MVAARKPFFSTVSLNVGPERPRGMGSFKELRLPCLEASHPPRPSGLGQIHSAELEVHCPTLANPLPSATSFSSSGDTLSHVPPVAALYFLSFSSAVANPTAFSTQNIGPPR